MIHRFRVSSLGQACVKAPIMLCCHTKIHPGLRISMKYESRINRFFLYPRLTQTVIYVDSRSIPSHLDIVHLIFAVTQS